MAPPGPKAKKSESAAKKPLVVVAGATGHIGGEVVRELCAHGYRVKAIVRPGRAASMAAAHRLESLGAHVVFADPTKADTLAGVADGAEAVVSALGVRCVFFVFLFVCVCSGHVAAARAARWPWRRCVACVPGGQKGEGALPAVSLPARGKGCDVAAARRLVLFFFFLSRCRRGTAVVRVLSSHTHARAPAVPWTVPVLPSPWLSSRAECCVNTREHSCP